MRARSPIGIATAFTLIELLLTITIIMLLISLLLPALNRGHHKVRQIRCSSNLHQAGLGYLSFAHAHEDKFPIQVSTNQGGSAEYVEAGNAIRGSFFFSYKHFVPLASELETPQILVCPTDSRLPATNFASLSNSNLSYFSALAPQSGNSDSVLAGDRNLERASNTIVRLGPQRPLRWTREMHQYRGNVLFADGHVAQLSDTLGQNSGTAATTTSLVMPDVPTPATPSGPIESGGGGGGGGGGSGPAISGGNLKASFPARNAGFALTNGGTITNLQITSGPRNTPASAFVIPGPGGPNRTPPMPSFDLPQPPISNASVATSSVAATEPAGEQQVEEAHQQLVQTARDLANKGARSAYEFPWWLILALLLSALWLLKRTHDRRQAPATDASTAPGSSHAQEK